jgi:predicted protein tyrosine phosphatase
MFLLHVRSHAEARRDIAAGWPTRIVSLVPLPGCLGPHHLALNTGDICGLPQDALARAAAHLGRVLDFTRPLTGGDWLLVHCQAGISRSPAMAIAICVQYGMAPRQAFGHVRAACPEMDPDWRILQAADAHFGLRGELSALDDAPADAWDGDAA